MGTTYLHRGLPPPLIPPLPLSPLSTPSSPSPLSPVLRVSGLFSALILGLSSHSPAPRASSLSSPPVQVLWIVSARFLTAPFALSIAPACLCIEFEASLVCSIAPARLCFDLERSFVDCAGSAISAADSIAPARPRSISEGSAARSIASARLCIGFKASVVGSIAPACLSVDFEGSFVDCAGSAISAAASIAPVRFPSVWFHPGPLALSWFVILYLVYDTNMSSRPKKGRVLGPGQVVGCMSKLMAQSSPKHKTGSRSKRAAPQEREFEDEPIPPTRLNYDAPEFVPTASRVKQSTYASAARGSVRVDESKNEVRSLSPHSNSEESCWEDLDDD